MRVRAWSEEEEDEEDADDDDSAGDRLLSPSPMGGSLSCLHSPSISKLGSLNGVDEVGDEEEENGGRRLGMRSGDAGRCRRVSCVMGGGGGRGGASG